MRRLAAVALAIGVCIVAMAHVGSPNVVFDGAAGPYPVRVVVRPPQVVPGLAEVIVRVSDDDVTHVAIRPVFWRAGVKGAPSSDEMRRVPGQARMYTGELWLMTYGSYSVYVTVGGKRGSGVAIVPVASFATGRLDLPVPLGAPLVVLGVLLLAGLITIVRAAAGDSLLPAGQVMDAATRRRANVATVIAVPVLLLVVFGGARWWSAEDARYQRRMFRPPAAIPSITVDSAHRTLTLDVRDTAQFRSILAPVVPDHGKMMHLFLVSTSGMQAFAHLHPVETDSLRFVTELPWMPAGRYLLFADIATENGLSLTVSNRLEMPPAPGRVTPSDPDDSYDRTTRVTFATRGAARALDETYSMVWNTTGPPVAGQTTDLTFTIVDSTMQPVSVQPYLGMAGHAVVVRHDASVFIHLHPMGTVAPVTQRVFAARDRGDTTAAGRLSALSDEHTMSMPRSGQLSFPYEFPKPGRYRIWVQVKPRDRVLTGTFDVDVR